MARKKQRYGLDDDLISQFQADYNQQQAAQQQQMQSQQPQPSKGFLLDQLSTLGGIGGSLGGAASGAALGSVVPIVGTAAGGILGALLGGALGGGAGEAAENIATGDDLMKNVGKEAALNGLFGAGPIRAGSLVARTAGGLARGAGKDALSQAGTKALTDTPIRSALGLSNVGGKLQRTGGNLLGAQANLGKKEIRELGAGRTPASVIGNLNERYGARNVNQIAEVAPTVTGANGAYSELTRNAIGNSKGVDLGDIRNVANDLMIDLAPNVDSAARKRILDSVKNSVVKANGGSKGSLNPLSNPLEAFDVAKAWETKAAQLLNKATTTSADQEQAQVYKALARTVNDRLFNAPGVSEGLQLAKSNAVKTFKDLAAKAPTGQQRKMYQKLAKEAEGINDIKTLRSLQSDWVAGSAVNEGVERAQAGASQAIGGRAQGLGKAVQNPLNMIAMPLDAATPAIGSALARAGRSVEGRAGSANPLGPVGITTREGIMGALTGGEGLRQPQKPEAMQQPGLDALGTQMASPQAVEPSIGGVTKSQLEQAMMAAAADGNSGAFNDLKKMHDLLDSGQQNLNATQQKTLQTTSNGLDTLDQMQAVLAQAGGGSGALGGTLKGIAGQVGLDNSAKVYNDSVGGWMPRLFQALGKTDAPSESEIRSMKQQLPQITDPPEVAQQKIALLRQAIQQAQSHVGAY